LLEAPERPTSPWASALSARGPARSGDVGLAELWALFSTKEGEPRAKMATNSVTPAARDWLIASNKAAGAAGRIRSAKVARTASKPCTWRASMPPPTSKAKESQAGLDFGDLVARTRELLTVRADAMWVLFKLDGGIDHVLLDEAQDTAPEQWEIISP